MTRISLPAFLPRLLLLPVLLALATPATASEERVLSGNLEISSTSVALGFGGSWGDGVLTLIDGSKHAFSIRGFDMVKVGVTSVNARGEVFNMKKLADFEGRYTAFTGGITAGMGGDFTSMSNDKGVVIKLTSTSAGIDLSISGRGITITLEEIQQQ